MSALDASEVRLPPSLQNLVENLRDELSVALGDAAWAQETAFWDGWLGNPVLRAIMSAHRYRSSELPRTAVEFLDCLRQLGCLLISDPVDVRPHRGHGHGRVQTPRGEAAEARVTSNPPAGMATGEPVAGQGPVGSPGPAGPLSLPDQAAALWEVSRDLVLAVDGDVAYLVCSDGCRLTCMRTRPGRFGVWSPDGDLLLETRLSLAEARTVVGAGR